MKLRPAVVVAAVAAAGAVAVRHRLVEVAGASMEPCLVAGERLVTVPAVRRLLRPGRIVVVERPDAPGHFVVKRVARITGDRIEVLGDASVRSTDSRQWGAVPIRSVRAVVVCRWPDVRQTLWHVT